MDKPVETYVREIIRNQMVFDNQFIWLQYEDYKIPAVSDDLFCIVGCLNQRPVDSHSEWDSINLTETQWVQMRADIHVDLISRDEKARNRRNEVLMALNSFYSKNQQDKYGFRIFKLPTVWRNTSQPEGGSNIHRYTLIIPVYYQDSKVINFDYYDKFQGELWTEDKMYTFNFED